VITSIAWVWLPWDLTWFEKQLKEIKRQRPGSGRPKGSVNKASVERQAIVAASGRTPLDVMLDNMRWADQEAAKILAKLLSPDAPTDTTELLETIKTLLRLRERAAEWAKDAAPYVHPRLAAIAHRHVDANGQPLTPTINLTIMQPPEPKPRLTSTGPYPLSEDHAHPASL
jgi:hypothetical protein